MSNKSLKGSSKHKRRSNPNSTTIKDVQNPQLFPSLSKTRPLAKSEIVGEETLRYRSVVPEIRRSLIVGAITLAVLFILYFLLR